ncbi:fatty acid desaturase [Podospora didyma]|uniref:Delta 8-(E)-sphingolipid desaturase n=1 Tax=Podospora didyma TaxID=330526 RepID=A0AAE0NUM1_9PEZI|nr:fatty acid desaturase [Podospora didyma]
MMERDKIMTPCAVRELIADGQTIVIFEDYVLRLDSWLGKHPGGSLAILHMVGKDATDEINAYHLSTTLKTMKAYRIGRKPPGVWANTTPPIRGGIYEKRDASLFDTPVDVPEGSSDTDGVVSDDSISLASDDQSSLSSISSLTESITDLKDVRSSEEKQTMHWRAPVFNSKTGEKGGLAADDHASSAPVAAASRVAMSGDAFVAQAVQQEVDHDNGIYPSLDPAVQQEIVIKYRQLHQKVQDMGYYECPYLDYGKEMLRYSLLFTGFIVALRYEWFITSAIMLGTFWQQIMFTAHDAGHRAITKNFVVDTLIGMFVADFCCGLSIGWWKSSHNVHHLITNSPEHDPDIQNTPIFATAPAFLKNLRSSYYDGFIFYWDAAAEFLVPYQAYTYYPIMGLARFNLYLLSWLHVLSAKSSALGSSKAWWIRPGEIAFMTCYWYIFGYLLLWCTLPNWTIRVAFVLISHIVTMPLHVQITLSHWGMSHSEMGETESFPQRQLRTTMDVDCPAWFDFYHGGLQFQAVHHLFPRVPRHNLRKVQVLVREFCKDTGIPYSILGFVDGNKKVIGRLGELGEQVKIMVNCQKYMAETGESGLH